MSPFENHEKIENFHYIQFPSNSTVLHGNESGSYVSKFSKGVSSVGLIDIPDNSNVELYELTSNFLMRYISIFHFGCNYIIVNLFHRDVSFTI